MFEPLTLFQEFETRERIVNCPACATDGPGLSLQPPFVWLCDDILRDRSGLDWLDVVLFDTAGSGSTQEECLVAFEEKKKRCARRLVLEVAKWDWCLPPATRDELTSGLFARLQSLVRPGEKSSFCFFEQDGFLVGVDAVASEGAFLSPVSDVPVQVSDDPGGGYYSYGEYGLAVLSGRSLACGRIMEDDQKTSFQRKVWEVSGPGRTRRVRDFEEFPDAIADVLMRSYEDVTKQGVDLSIRLVNA